MIRNVFSFIIFFFIFLGSPISVYAASVSLFNPNTSTISDINSEYELDVVLNIDTADGTKYYLRGVFFKENTSNYCGQTWNGSNWFVGPYSSNDGWKNFPSVQIASNAAQIRLKAKLDSNDSGCKESGNYNFKVQRFTESGSATFDPQNQTSLSVTIPTSTPQPSATNTPAPTTKPSSTPKVDPTSIQKITPTKTSTATSSGLRPAPALRTVADTGLILGETISSDADTPTPTTAEENIGGEFPFAFILIGMGGLLLAAGGIYAGILKKKNKI